MHFGDLLWKQIKFDLKLLIVLSLYICMKGSDFHFA